MTNFLAGLALALMMQGPTIPMGSISTGTAPNSFTIVETVGTTATSACTTGVTLTFVHATTSGEAIFVTWEAESAGGSTTIADNKGGGSSTYTKDWELTSWSSHASTGEAHTLTTASGITTVTVTAAASNTHCVVAAMHAKRSSGSWSVDQTGAASNTSISGSPWAGPSAGVTTTAANELLIGQVGVRGTGNCAVAVSGAWTQGYANYDSNGYAMQLSYQTVSSIQTSIQNTGTTTVCTGTTSAPGIVTFE